MRTISLIIKPQRNINKIELIAKEAITFNTIGVQDVFLDKKNPDAVLKVNKGTILSYFMAKNDSILKVDFTIEKSITPNINIIESSFDLLDNPLFNITPRTNIMMPMPFVMNDAIITLQKLKL